MSFDIERLQKSTRRVTKFLGKNSKRPGSDTIHKLRTSTRSLETTFVTLGLDSQEKVKRLLQDLGEVRKYAGKVRDMDVLTGDAHTVKQEGEQDCLVQLLEYLGAKRDRCARKLRRVIMAATPQLRRNLKRNSKYLEEILEQAQDNPIESDAARVTMARSIQLSSELNRPARLNKNNLHPYRLKVKELLNVLQLSDQTGDLAFLKNLAEVKDAIGEWHDWEELIAIATKLLDHGASCKLIRHMRDVSNSKYERAVFLIKELRSNYLEGNGTKPAHRANRAVLSTPVLTATSAVARN